jgi:hypothetical protein
MGEAKRKRKPKPAQNIRSTSVAARLGAEDYARLRKICDELRCGYSQAIRALLRAATERT